MHVNVRIHPRWTFTEVRRAALALARAVERRAPTLASSKWWKEERHGVFLDYNQNAKDRTTASAYSVRPLPDARVSAPLHWHEVPDANPADFTVMTMPQLFAERGNPQEAMDASPGSLDQLLALAARDEAEGLGDAPWPPHFVKQEGEAKRVQPSKAKSFSAQSAEGFGAHRFKKRSKAVPDSVILSESGEAAESNNPPYLQTHLILPTHSAMNPISISHPPKPAGPPQNAHRNIHSSPSPTPPTNPPPKRASTAGKTAHPEAARHLAVDDILIDRMRGASSIWYRIRLNLRNVPEDQRPAQSTPDPDDDPTRAWREELHH